MKKTLIILFAASFSFGKASAQIDLENIDLNKIDLKKIELGKIDLDGINLDKLLRIPLNVKKGWAPKFSLGKKNIDKIFKVGELIGLKKNDQANKLFKTFRTGRTIYKVASYAGMAVAAYGAYRSFDKAAAKKEYQSALASGLGTLASGVVVKMLTKGASYKAVDVFNGVVSKKLKDILSVRPASQTLGVGLYVQL